MKILIFGLPGSGKSTLAKPLADLVGGVHVNADEVRLKYEGHDVSKWDFSKLRCRWLDADRNTTFDIFSKSIWDFPK